MQLYNSTFLMDFGANECILLKVHLLCCEIQGFAGLGSRINCWCQKFVPFWMRQSLKFGFFMDFGWCSLPGVTN